MYTITKEFHFSAAHHLHGLPEDHPCARLHGHNYIVVLELSCQDADLQGPPGWVRDFGELSSFKEWLDDMIDHRNLNDWFDMNGWGSTTAENLALQLYKLWVMSFPELVAVCVSETPKTWAEYRRG